MFHRIREAMKIDDGAAFKGDVEADETCVGRKLRTNYFPRAASANWLTDRPQVSHRVRHD